MSNKKSFVKGNDYGKDVMINKSILLGGSLEFIIYQFNLKKHSQKYQINTSLRM